MPAEEIVGSEESEAQGINQKISFGAARWLAGLLVVVCKWEKVECRVGGQIGLGGSATKPLNQTKPLTNPNVQMCTWENGEDRTWMKWGQTLNTLKLQFW